MQKEPFQTERMQKEDIPFADRQRLQSPHREWRMPKTYVL